MGRAYTNLSPPSAPCKAGVAPQTAAVHMHTVLLRSRLALCKGQQTQAALTHQAAQPQGTQDSWPGRQLLPPSRDMKGLQAGWAGKSEGGPARMLCCWWCQIWAALETWAWWGTFVLSGLCITLILKQSQEQPSASLKSFHLCLLSHTCPRAGFDPTASITSSSFTFCLSY